LIVLVKKKKVGLPGKVNGVFVFAGASSVVWPVFYTKKR